ncbi:MAG: TonB-dependent receptor, partial [Bacteroidaceae bacterium]|nr:TonB-dependent receptor [Bacteroidaceae bacterium]
MFSNQPTRNTVVTWRRFSGKGYAAFRSLGREIRIGVLAVSTLMAAHNDSLATRTDSLRIVKDAISSSDLSLSEATVTGSQLPVSLDKAWSKIVVISRQEIDNAKCQTINDILKLCPNVDVRQRGAMGVQTDISLGGGTFDQITFMLNGININNPQTGHLAADFPVAIADIERIEILDGASARTFGSQALNGIINIITRTEPTSQVGIHAEGGSYGTFGGGANVNLAGNKGGTAQWRNRLSGDYLRTDGAVQNSDFNRIRLFYQGRYTADNVLLNWQAGYNKQRYGANTFYSAKFPNQWEEGTRYMAALKGDAAAGNIHFTPSLSFTRNFDHFQLIKDTQTGENFHRNDVLAATLSGYSQWVLGRTALGGELRHEDILSSNLGRPLDEAQRVRIEHHHDRYYDHRDSRTNMSLFLEHAVLLRQWSINAGVMANRNSAVDDKFRFYPGIDISYRPARTVKLYASWNKSMRMPTFTDLYY